MFRPRVIPCLLLKGKGLVKTVKFKKSRYIGDPINAVKIFNDMEADELVFLDITATNEKRTIAIELIEKIGDEANMPFAVGGGISSVDEIKMILNAGAEKVVINTSTVTNPELVSQASELFGNQSIIVSIDAKKNIYGKYKVYINSGKKSTGINPVDHAIAMEKMGAGEILINSIDHDGMMNGYDIELIKSISNIVQLPVAACGGAGKPEDLSDAIYKGGASAVAAGSLFVYHGPRKAVLINYPDKRELRKIFYLSSEMKEI